MSALAQIRLLPLSSSRVSEVELLRVVSNIVWNARNEEQALSSIGTAILQVPGLTGFRYEPAEGVPSLPLYEATRPSDRLLNASAISAAAANGFSWGQVRIFFEPRSRHAVESPVRLAKYLGQQIGILLHRLFLHREQKKNRTQLDALDRLIRRRKLIHRAAGVLAERRNVHIPEAISLMLAYARRNRRRLHEIAESLIFGYNESPFTRPSLRRLASYESTRPVLQRAST